MGKPPGPVWARAWSYQQVMLTRKPLPIWDGAAQVTRHAQAYLVWELDPLKNCQMRYESFRLKSQWGILTKIAVVQWLTTTCQCRGQRFNPWSGKIPYASEELNTDATATGLVPYGARAVTTEPKSPRARAPQQETPLHGEACALQWRPRAVRNT